MPSTPSFSLPLALAWIISIPELIALLLIITFILDAVLVVSKPSSLTYNEASCVLPFFAVFAAADLAYLHLLTVMFTMALWLDVEPETYCIWHMTYLCLLYCACLPWLYGLR